MYHTRNRPHQSQLNEKVMSQIHANDPNRSKQITSERGQRQRVAAQEQRFLSLGNRSQESVCFVDFASKSDSEAKDTNRRPSWH